MNIAIIGGGGAAHLLGALLGNRNHRVRILSSRPEKWKSRIKLVDGENNIYGDIDKVSNDPDEVLHNAHVAVLCMPVHQYPHALGRIMPFLSKNPQCIVGTVYGQGGFDWMVRSIAEKNNLPVPPHFAIGLLPWIVRTLEYGETVVSYGPKLRNGIATSDDATYDFLDKNLLPDFSYSFWNMGHFERVPNFLTLTLTVDNQIIHPSRCYALAINGKPWESLDEIPFFYRDWDDSSADVLRGIDNDYTNVRLALIERCPSLGNKYDLNYLALEHWSYGSHNPDIKASFVNSTTLRYIKPPVVMEEGKYIIDVNHRFFKDDFAYGLEICQWFADELGVDVPNVENIIKWYRKNVLPKQDEIVDSGVPLKYGFPLSRIIDGV